VVALSSHSLRAGGSSFRPFQDRPFYTKAPIASIICIEICPTMLQEEKMNPANLQLEGLYVAMASLMLALRKKGVLSAQEIETALLDAEDKLSADPARQTKLSDANSDAICFPVRLLRLANKSSSNGEQLSFSELAALVGRTKPD
jgi:hypothetical protein